MIELIKPAVSIDREHWGTNQEDGKTDAEKPPATAAPRADDSPIESERQCHSAIMRPWSFLFRPALRLETRGFASIIIRSACTPCSPGVPAVEVSQCVQRDLTSFGLGFQASYTLAKSIDDTSAAVGGFISGFSGAISQAAPQDPFDTRADEGPSNFDIHNALAFSLFQDLHADRVRLLRPFGKTLTAGWQLLGIGTLTSGLPFTVYLIRRLNHPPTPCRARITPDP
jgi:hypothetical protein